MLVLGRKTGEIVHVGSAITITVLAVNGSQVRIGIDAPTQVPVTRMKLCGPGAERAGNQEEHREETDHANDDP